jgi:hypothetical protein
VVALCFGKNKGCRVLISLGGLCFGLICSRGSKSRGLPACRFHSIGEKSSASCHVTQTRDRCNHQSSILYRDELRKGMAKFMTFPPQQYLLIMKAMTEHIGIRHNGSDLYAGGARLESRPGHRLKIFVDFLSLSGQIRRSLVRQEVLRRTNRLLSLT